MDVTNYALPYGTARQLKRPPVTILSVQWLVSERRILRTKKYKIIFRIVDFWLLYVVYNV